MRIDDDLLTELKDLSRRRAVSISQLLNKALRTGLEDLKQGGAVPRRRYREKTYSMGKPLLDLTKALQLSTALEDEAIIEKLRRGK